MKSDAEIQTERDKLLYRLRRRQCAIGALLIVTILAVNAAFTWAQHTPFEAAIARFEAQIAQDAAYDGLGSIAAAVVIDHDVIWRRAFGWADVARQIPADPETIYRIGSITKSFTAVVLVQLTEKGVLSLDDPVERYLPEIKKLDGPVEDSTSITFRQLASHTAGLIKEPKLSGANSGPIAEWENKILASIPTTSFLASPGQRYSYSNIGFGILGLAISRAAEKPFMELVNDLIFKPLGMKQSGFILTPGMRKHLATGYDNRRHGTVNGERAAREHAGRGYKVPNGGIYSTVGDLARFVAGQTGSASVQILSAASRAEMHKYQTQRNKTAGYGLGFHILNRGRWNPIVGSGGVVSGYKASLVFNPESKIGVILLRNYNRGSTNQWRAAITLLRRLVEAR